MIKGITYNLVLFFLVFCFNSAISFSEYNQFHEITLDLCQLFQLTFSHYLCFIYFCLNKLWLIKCMVRSLNIFSRLHDMCVIVVNSVDFLRKLVFISVYKIYKFLLLKRILLKFETQLMEVHNLIFFKGFRCSS